MSNSNSSNGGMGFFGTLGIIFIVLKLLNVIAWSWWLVLLPIYGGLALVLSILALAIIAGAFSSK